MIWQLKIVWSSPISLNKQITSGVNKKALKRFQYVNIFSQKNNIPKPGGKYGEDYTIVI